MRPNVQTTAATPMLCPDCGTPHHPEESAAPCFACGSDATRVAGTVAFWARLHESVSWAGPYKSAAVAEWALLVVFDPTIHAPR